MSTIIKPDPFIDAYVLHKEMHPEARLVWRQFRKGQVDRVDRIVELAHGNRDFVTSENDWKVVEELISFFAHEWPHEFNEFASSIGDIRHSKRSGGYSESREMQHVGSIPPRLMKIIRIIFPAQQWDKKFTSKFVRRFAIFKVGGVNN